MDHNNFFISTLNRKYGTKYSEFNELINQHKGFLEYIKDNICSSDDKEIKNLERKNQNYSQILKSVLKFFKNLDTDIYNDVKRIFNRENDYVVIPMIHTGGKSSCGLDKTIFAAVNGNCLDTINFIHELTHGVGQRTKLSQKPIDDCIGEIEGMFMDKISQAYFHNNGYISDQDYTSLQNDRKRILKNNISILLSENQIFNMFPLPLSEKDFIDIQLSFIGKNERPQLIRRFWDMGKENTPTGKYYFRYIVGEVVSDLLYEKYLTDPEKTMEKFKNFLSKNAEINLFDATKMLLDKTPRKVMKDYINKFNENENE